MAAHASVAADNRVDTELRQHCLPPPMFNIGRPVAAEYHINRNAQREGRQHCARQDEANSEEPPSGAERRDFTKTDRTNRDHGHVEGVNQGHTRQQVIARRA